MPQCNQSRGGTNSTRALHSRMGLPNLTTLHHPQLFYTASPGTKLRDIFPNLDTLIIDDGQWKHSKAHRQSAHNIDVSGIREIIYVVPYERSDEPWGPLDGTWLSVPWTCTGPIDSLVIRITDQEVAFFEMHKELVSVRSSKRRESS